MLMLLAKNNLAGAISADVIGKDSVRLGLAYTITGSLCSDTGVFGC